jgi:hypothetical protein
VPETEHFINDGFGWECKRCRESGSGHTPPGDEHAPSGSGHTPPGDAALARFFREGEAEEREPRLSAQALARWKDSTRRTLCCARCGVEEDISGGGAV